MLSTMFRFELKYHFNQISFKIGALLFFVLGFSIVTQGGFGGPGVYQNSAYAITSIVSLLSLFSLFSCTLFSSNVVLRDAVYKMDSAIFTTSVKRFPYFIVKFVGLLTAVFLLLVFAVTGILIGSLFIDSSRVGPFATSYFLHPLFVFGLPNVLFSTSMVFCTTLLTKNVRAIYATGVLLYILYMAASILGNSPLLATSTLRVNDTSILPFLIDPFGLASFFDETRNWSDLQKNQQLFPIKEVFLANRLIWSGFSILIIAVTYRFFEFRLQKQQQSITKQALSKQSAENQIQVFSVSFKSFEVFPDGFKYNLAAFFSQLKLEVISLFKHIPFMVMLLLWIFIFATELKDTISNGPYQIISYPTTGAIIEEMRSIKFSLILIIFYAAELITREKAAHIESLIYSTPVRNQVLWASKCLTLFLLVIILVTANIGIGIGVQLSHGYFKIEFLKYLSLYYYSAFPFFLLVILIVFIQNLASNKYLGMLLNIFVVFVLMFAPRMGIEHYLFRFAAIPELQFSYFNGFGHYATAFNWYLLYWTGFAGILALLTIGMWQSVNNTTFISRLKSILKVVSKGKFVLFLFIVVWISSAAFIYDQTNIIGQYKNKKEKLAWAIGYEKKYKPLSGLPQPVIKTVTTEVDLFTEKDSYRVKGSYKLKNEGNVPISRIWISLDPSVNHFDINIKDANKHSIDQVYNQQFIDLKTALQPGSELMMDFSLEVIRSGFVPFDTENSVVKNGTYIEMEKYVPQFGYNQSSEIEDKIKRKEVGLPELAVEVSSDRNYHLIDLETTISTALDQKIVTVGDLKRTWTANNRRYFRYKTTLPINFMFALSSATYEIKREQYKGIELSLYYLAGHEYNLKAMVRAMKDALDYCSSNFSPYPLKQLTLAEIPQYRGAATAYPGLVFSAERINFLSNYSDKNKVDQSYAITVHEIAHQWWANKLTPVYGPGAAMLTESLAKYTEAMVIEKHFGEMYLSGYLKADNQLYFLQRNSTEKELPLMHTIDQGFVHYSKGGLTMFAMKEALGETMVNHTLNQLIIKHSSPNEKAKSEDLVNELLQLAPINQKNFIYDSFSQVVTYQMRIEMLNCKSIGDGRFNVELKVNLGKNKLGVDELLEPDMDVDIAMFDQPKEEWNKDTKPFYLKKHRFNKLVTKLSLVVDFKPKTVAIDPYNYLLDEDLKDHIQEIK